MGGPSSAMETSDGSRMRVKSISYAGEVPAMFTDAIKASEDPLTPPALLRHLYCWSQGDLSPYLASNPSLPLDIIAEMVESKDNRLYNILISNASLTLSQIRMIAGAAVGLGDTELDEFHTVIDIFDYIMKTKLNEMSFNNRFVSALLLSSTVDAEGYTERLAKYKYDLVDYIYEDSRFNPNQLAEYVDFTKPDRFGQNELMVSHIINNPRISKQVLTNVIKRKASISLAKYEASMNFNCPIEVSASLHIKNFDSYKWMPTLLLNLETKTNERLTLTSGAGA